MTPEAPEDIRRNILVRVQGRLAHASPEAIAMLEAKGIKVERVDPLSQPAPNRKQRRTGRARARRAK